MELTTYACLRRSPDAELHSYLEGTRRQFVLRQARSGKYRRLSAAAALLWQRVDGESTMVQVANALTRAGSPESPDAAMHFLQRLTVEGFLVDPARDVEQHRGNKPTQSFFSLLYLLLTYRLVLRRILGIPVDRWFASLHHYITWILFTRPLQIGIGLLSASGLYVFISTFGRHAAFLNGSKPAFIPWMVYGFLIFTMLLHETAHGVAVKQFKRQVLSVGVGWYWFGPIGYVDTTEMWLSDSRSRVVVSLAGPCSDLVIAAVCSLVSTQLSGLAFHLAFLLAGMLYQVTIGNLSPAIELDGYYVLSDLTNRPNLRRDSLLWLVSRFVPSVMDKSSDVPVWMKCYAVFAVAYFAVFTAGSVLWLHLVLRSLPETIAWSLAACAGCLPVLGLVGDLRSHIEKHRKRKGTKRTPSVAKKYSLSNSVWFV